ncbi:hypothetical protein M2277_006440 [Paenibacillus sp. LBL]|uniref:DUF2577 domain-containing protein n=1 Tax=Paenibacillus sp. LBL TaxID=2940563 RepID=UPI0024765BC5|nr:DUF2577 domain-containing protein [Paenibacillus sp. LBL]MDH6675719.1 hypothetical protein [Paenibacillus sp. LBL]
MTQLIEGSGVSQFKALIKTLGYNKDVDIEFATVTAAPPDLRIKIDNMPVELDADDLVICEHLTEHTRKATISSGTVQIDGQASSLAITDADVKFDAALAVGDRVIVASNETAQVYVILDRIGGV